MPHLTPPIRPWTFTRWLPALLVGLVLAASLAPRPGAARVGSGAPVLFAPDDGAVIDGLPRFEWSAPSGPNDPPSRLEIAAGSDPWDVVVAVETADGTYEQRQELDRGVGYRWRVGVPGDDGAVVWSEVRDFTLSTPPPEPTALPTTTATATSVPASATPPAADTATSTAVPTAQPTAPPTRTALPTATRKPTRTATPSRTATRRPRTATPLGRSTETPSATRRATRTATRSPAIATAGRPTRGPVTSPAKTPAGNTPTATRTSTSTRTPLPTGTATATRTALPTKTATATRPALPATATSTASAATSPTLTTVLTATATATESAAGTSTATSTEPPTVTPPEPPSVTSTAAVAATATATGSPTATATATATGTATVAATATRRAEVDGIVTNPSFERGATGWSTEPGAAVVDEAASGGSRSMRLAASGGYAGQWVDLGHGQVYELSAWGRLDVPGNAGQVGVVFFARDGTRLRSLEPGVLLVTGTTFAAGSLRFSVPASVDRMSVAIYKGAGGSRMYVDDVVVRPVFGAPDPAPPTGGCQHLMLPGYFDPSTGLWDQATTGGSALGMAVFNPASGPGARYSAAYAEKVNAARAAGRTPFGYVYALYGERPMADVLADIDRYAAWYGITNVFLDNGATDLAGVPYFRSVVAHVHGNGGVALINFGWTPHQAYMAFTDIANIFEDSAAVYATAYDRPDWILGYPATRFSHIVSDTPAVRVAEVVALSRQRNAAYVWISDDNGPVLYKNLPTYWAEINEAVATGC